MRFLLEVNVLIALIDPVHIHHGLAHDWFEREGGEAWATCPIVQNGALRIVGSPAYTNSPKTPAAVADVLAEFLATDGHEFWPDDASLLGNPLVLTAKIANAKQVTDTYLLALARSRNGRLATFDRRLMTEAVIGGDQALLVIGQ